MKVELLYFDGCENWPATLAELRDVLREHGLPDDADVVKVETNADARRLRFVGSPTVRVNGVDVEPNAPHDGFALDCRLYWVDGKVLDTPPREWLVRAITEAARS